MMIIKIPTVKSTTVRIVIIMIGMTITVIIMTPLENIMNSWMRRAHCQKQN